jgi:arsenate reductase-like glutaredoxin family protein
MNTHDGLLVGSLIVSDKPTCATCRRLFTLLTERGIDFERVHYIVDPLSPSGA